MSLFTDFFTRSMHSVAVDNLKCGTNQMPCIKYNIGGYVGMDHGKSKKPPSSLLCSHQMLHPLNLIWKLVSFFLENLQIGKE